MEQVLSNLIGDIEACSHFTRTCQTVFEAVSGVFVSIRQSFSLMFEVSPTRIDALRLDGPRLPRLRAASCRDRQGRSTMSSRRRAGNEGPQCQRKGFRQGLSGPLGDASGREKPLQAGHGFCRRTCRLSDQAL
jgi:hypothetical protein